MNNIVISMFDKTQCHIFDIQHEGCQEFDDNIIAYGGDVRDHKATLTNLIANNNVVAVFAFPPCTDLAVSGARWFKRKAKENPDYRREAMGLVYFARDIGELSGAPYFIENPVSVISSEWRKPDYSFHPWEYTNYCPDEERANFRSATPMGFSLALYYALTHGAIPT
jgi:hypothetical protein